MRETRVLVVDDEPAITRALRPVLQRSGFDVETAATGAEALARLSTFAADAILLDLGLPDIDGVQLTRELRKQTQAPIIVLSVRDSDRDKVAALDNGADDYVTKPFSTDELLARLRAALRRSPPADNNSGAALAPTNPSEKIAIGAITLDAARHEVFVNDKVTHLSPTEFSLLELLMRNAGRLVTHRTLLHKVWGPEYISSAQLLRVYIGQLRAKIEDTPDQPTYIITEPGVGYRFRDAA